jgi:hypothetical protein
MVGNAARARRRKKFSAVYCVGCITRTEAPIDMQAERIHSWKSGPRYTKVYKNGRMCIAKYYLDLALPSVNRVTREEEQFDALFNAIWVLI